MKKLIKNQFAFLTMLIVVMLFSSINTKMHGQIVLKSLGSAINAYTQIGSNRTRVSYAPGINTVLFVHRGDPTIAGSSGNQAMFDYSSNGGSSWTNNIGPVIQAGVFSPSVRYPQGILYNPAGNTSPSNARIFAMASHASGQNNGWGTISVGQSKLDGTLQKARVFNTGDAFLPQSLTERIPGEYWTVDDTTTDGKITFYKGLYQSSNDSMKWSVQFQLPLSRNLFSNTVDGSLHYLNPKIAFSPNGQYGWIATNGDIAGGVSDSTLYPIFWSTTNGGQTWTGPHVVKLNNFTNLSSAFNGLKPTATFENDLIVDKNGNPHFVFVVAPRSIGNPYAIIDPTNKKYPIINITKINNSWAAVAVDSVSSFRGTISGTNLTQDNTIMLSRTKDGSKIFYSWIDTEPSSQSTLGANDFPNLYTKGYNLNTNSFGIKISPTKIYPTTQGKIYLPSMSEIVSDSTIDGYKLHTVITSFTGDENVQVNFKYIDNLSYPANFTTYIYYNNYPTNTSSLGLDGIDDFGSIANTFFQNVNQRNFTIEFYMKAEPTQSPYPGIWGKTGFWSEININFFNSGKLNLMYATNVNPNQYFNSDTVSWQANKWDHYAFVGDASTNQMRAYKNGKLDGVTLHGTPNWAVANNDSKIGAVFQGWSLPFIQYFKGYIDDFRVSDIARYNSNFTPPQNILSDANTRVLYNFNAVQNNIVSDSSGNNNHLTLQNGAFLDSDVPYTGNNMINVPNYVPKNGLLGYWPFNGNAIDSSGNGNNGVAVGTSYIADKNGNPNSAISFTPTSHVNIPANLTLNNSKGLTFASWVNFNNIITSSGNGNTIVDFSDGNCVNCWSYRYYIVQDANKIHFGREGSSGGAGFRITANKTLSTNTWYYVVGTIDSLTGQARLYINGTLEGSANANTNPISISTGATNSKIFGMATLAPNNGNQLNGKLDNIGIWNRALTQSEVTALYNQAPNPVLPSYVPTTGLLAYYPFNGNANDASGNAYNLTQVGTNVVAKNDRFNNLNSSYYLGGANPENKFNFPTSFYPAYNSLNSGSISFWMNIDSIANHSHYFGFDNTFFVKQKNGQNSESYIGLSNGKIRFHMTGALPASNMQVDVKQLVTKKWYNLTVSWTPSNLYIYIDGLLSSSFSGNFGLSNTPSPDFISIGGIYLTGGSGCYSSIDDFGIWNRALTQSEITALYNTPTVAASDSLWVINKQTDTLAFPSQVKLSLKSNNITSKNISAYDIKLNYDASKLKFDSVTKTNTASANGSVIVNSATTGQVIIGWASSSSISSATLPLLNLFFTPIDSGKTTVSIANAIFNTDTVKNRYSKSVVNKFIFGDVDMNKIIQSYDASVVLKYSIGIDPLPTIDPLPWEPWRIKVASVDSAVAVDANDASLILKYSVGLITKFPKRGIAASPGYVTVNLENNELVVRSFEDMGGLNITFLDHLSDLGAPTYVHNTNALSAFNKQANMYKIGVAFSEAPLNGTVILRIPYTGLGNQTLNMELVENTASRNYQLNVVTGINDIKNSNIKIYPNPTNNIINIEGLNKNENITIQIFDVQGKLVITKTINEKGTIDLSELNKGVYVIKIGEVAKRIVKM
jgi:hypothetical protein